MTREIKFRAWNKKDKYLTQVLTIDWENGQAKLNGGEICGLHVVELMQFTGLKDKNGKEIWEDDIVEYYVKDTAVGRFRVKWDERGCWDYGMGLEHSKVIGNIYENPELLK